MKRLWQAFAIAILAGLCAEVSVQSSAMTLTAYGWLPLAVALCVFVITFAFMRTFKNS